jgi:hypothetical protein
MSDLLTDELPENESDNQQGNAPSIWGDVEVNWPEGVEDSIKEEAVLKAYVNPEDGEFNIPNVIKSLVHAKRAVGHDKVSIPTDESTDDEWSSFHEKVFGTPEDFENYNVEVSEDSVLDETVLNTLAEEMHALRIPEGAATEIISLLDDKLQELIATSDEEDFNDTQAGINELKEEWGDGFNRNLGFAQKVVTTFGDEDLGTYLKESGLGNDPEIIRLLSNIGSKLYTEDALVGVARQEGFNITPEEAAARIAKVQEDPNHPYWNKESGQHDLAQKEMHKLFKAKAAGKPKEISSWGF